MASASSLLSEEQFLCSICLDVFTDPVTTPCGHNYCKACITRYWNTNRPCKCPLCNKTFKRRPEVFVNTFISELADQFRKSLQLKNHNANREASNEVQQMIQERREKIHQIQHSVELSRKDADRERADSVQVFTALISCIERSQAELIDVIEEKQKTTEKEAEGFIKELQQEITQLEKRSSELKQLSKPEDHLHLHHNISSINTPPPTKDWTKVKVHHSPHVGTMKTALARLENTMRTAVAQLEKTLGQEMDLRRFQQYEVDVTLDPDTANGRLILSEDGKHASQNSDFDFGFDSDSDSDSDSDCDSENLPEDTKRFDFFACVLGKQSFSSGRFYYEVQVTGKNQWCLGVARESINRKGAFKMSPNDGFWSVMMRKNGNEYEANGDSDQVLLPVREELQKVGVFVDYEEGLVSFYDVEARVHLYSFTGCSFTEKLFPFFCPLFSDDDSAPLIISPVNHID